jgi:hypothetical protein
VRPVAHEQAVQPVVGHEPVLPQPVAERAQAVRPVVAHEPVLPQRVAERAQAVRPVVAHEPVPPLLAAREQAVQPVVERLKLPQAEERRPPRRHLARSSRSFDQSGGVLRHSPFLRYEISGIIPSRHYGRSNAPIILSTASNSMYVADKISRGSFLP